MHHGKMHLAIQSLPNAPFHFQLPNSAFPSMYILTYSSTRNNHLELQRFQHITATASGISVSFLILKEKIYHTLILRKLQTLVLPMFHLLWISEFRNYGIYPRDQLSNIQNPPEVEGHGTTISHI